MSDPVASTLQKLSEIKSTWMGGSPLALFGIGDGYVLSALASCSAPLTLGREQVVFIIEPDPAMVLAAMAIHDFSRADGAICQPRFRWFVGGDWQEQFEREVLNDFFLPFPRAAVNQSAAAGEIEAVLARVGDKILENDRRLACQAELLYRDVKAADLAAFFGKNPPRKPAHYFSHQPIYHCFAIFHGRRGGGDEESRLGNARTLIEPSGYQSRTRQAFGK